jgi:protein-L-isoaspartate(D-aspartate) O-methyltransferase
MARRTLNVVLLGFAGLVIVSGVACAMGDSNGAKEPAQGADPFESRRLRMVATQIEARGVADACVLDAMRRVHRHAFVPANVRDHAYTDRPLPIGHHQTISQPYIVALMTELVRPQSDTKVLEIGTGSGYQAAVLAECAGEVYTIEILPELGKQAGELLARLGYEKVHMRVGDGFDGWGEHAPFDAIVVTAAPPRIPQPLLDQLAPGGRLVIPVGEGFQNLVLVTRTDSGFERRTVTPVRFVPMTGKAQRKE